MIFVKEKNGKLTVTYNYYLEAEKGKQPYFIDVQKVVLDVD